MNLTAEIQKLQNYLRIKDHKTVVYGCEKLINKFPNNPLLFNLLALALHGNGNYLMAIDRFKRALDLDPKFLPAIKIFDLLNGSLLRTKLSISFP